DLVRLGCEVAVIEALAGRIAGTNVVEPVGPPTHRKAQVMRPLGVADAGTTIGAVEVSRVDVVVDAAASIEAEEGRPSLGQGMDRLAAQYERVVVIAALARRGRQVDEVVLAGQGDRIELR